ncbi:hypothetical protein CQW23_23924 [Capsicum baccatum]|uniref:Uncharacterized protein n=1 Tax=Capsicum baccatum TaxID=33114 RepID=A0A2G2VTC2_CAPBA|nr:hypothetical protein CQW23_23924 [Capsicum baccatum]
MQEEDRHNTTVKIDEGIRNDSPKESEEDLHNINEDLCKAITLYKPSLIVGHQTGITNSAIANIDTCNQQDNINSQSYISDSGILEFNLEKHRTRYASLLWDYGVNKACTEYISDNQDPSRPKCTFIPPEDREMIHVEQ